MEVNLFTNEINFSTFSMIFEQFFRITFVAYL